MPRITDTIRWWVGFVCAAGWLAISIKTALFVPCLFVCVIVGVLIVTRNFATTLAFKRRVVEVRLLHVGLDSRIWHPRDLWYVLTGRV